MPAKKRTAKGTFEKGTSGNPGGRPKGLAELVRKQTKDGAELVTFHLSVMRGKPVAGVVPEIADQLKSAAWLADRGFGKAQASVDVTSNGESVGSPLAGLTTEDLLEFVQRGRGED